MRRSHTKKYTNSHTLSTPCLVRNHLSFSLTLSLKTKKISCYTHTRTNYTLIEEGGGDDQNFTVSAHPNCKQKQNFVTQTKVQNLLFRHKKK